MPTGRKPSVTIATDSTSTRRTSVVRTRVSGSNSDKSLARRRSNMYSLNLSRRKSKPPELTPEQRSQLARDRFRRAVFKVKAMLRFGFPLRAPKKEEPKEKENKNVRYENTYRLEPHPSKRFQTAAAEDCLREVLDDNLYSYKYSKISAPNFSKALSCMALDKLKELGLERYKFVCNFMIGENKGQNFDFVSRSVWNPSTDNMATASIKTEAFFAVATVHAVYMD